MSDTYQLEKSIWDDGDFERMGWHDATIYGLAFGRRDFDLSLDIDYIFEWVHPVGAEVYFRFWIAPCTLVFHNVYELRLEADPYGGPMLSIDRIHRTDPRRPRNVEAIGKELEWLWTLECHHGEISFRSVGFKQYVRVAPVCTSKQSIELCERGGISFAVPPSA